MKPDPRAILPALLAFAMSLSAQPLPRLIEGNPASPVRVVIYESLQCGDCTTFRRLLDQHLLPKYASRVAFEHRDFPLAKQAWSRPAAIASRYFQSLSPELALAWRRHALNNLRTITSENFNQHLRDFAARHNASPDRALAALDDPSLAALIDRDAAEGVARGIARTPTALVNGRPFIETIPLADITRAIDEALAQEGTP